MYVQPSRVQGRSTKFWTLYLSLSMDPLPHPLLLIVVSLWTSQSPPFSPVLRPCPAHSEIHHEDEPWLWHFAHYCRWWYLHCVLYTETYGKVSRSSRADNSMNTVHINDGRQNIRDTSQCTAMQYSINGASEVPLHVIILHLKVHKYRSINSKESKGKLLFISRSPSQVLQTVYFYIIIMRQ